MSNSNITKKALAQALKDLIKEQPFKKIYVSDICEACALNRKSFYYHFRDKYDLVEWIFKSEFVSTTESASMRDRWVFLNALCEYLYQEHDFYIKILNGFEENPFRKFFEDYLFHMVEPLLRPALPESATQNENYNFYITYVTDAILIAVCRWLMEGVQTPPQKFIGQIKYVSELVDTSVVYRFTGQKIDPNDTPLHGHF